VLTFLPLIAITSLVKVARVIGKGLGVVDSGGWKKSLRKGSGDFKKGGEEGDRRLDDSKGVFEALSGFGGSKGGPLEGFLKILQMLV
jgi:hypothetical protein